MNALTPIVLTEGQARAKSQALDFFKEYQNTAGIFRIFGYAGTGKTFATEKIVEDIVAYILDEYNRPAVICYGAYTGQAALVMQRNGMPAYTVHSTLYHTNVPDKAKCKELRALAEAAVDPRERTELLEELNRAESLSFDLDPQSRLKYADLYVLDECSMIDQKMLDDILSFEVPILVLGDPGQLPPISGSGALTSGEPDVMLTEIMRQALDNPIIQLSMMAREGTPMPHHDYGAAKVMPIRGLKNDDMLAADQIITGKNNTRQAINKQIRKLKDTHDPYPVVGDKLVCLRNEKNLGIFNGLDCEVLEVLEEYPDWIKLHMRTADDKPLICNVLRAHFDAYANPNILKNLSWWDRKAAQEFDFAYAKTCHKMQGSQGDDIIFWDDKFAVWDKELRKRWLYTGITRAVKTLKLAN